MVGRRDATDAAIAKWIKVRGNILIIDCIKDSFETEFSFGYSQRKVTSLDEQTFQIDSLVQDVKDERLRGIVIRGFLSNIRELEKEKFETQKVIKTMVKRLQRLSQAYEIPVLF